MSPFEPRDAIRAGSEEAAAEVETQPESPYRWYHKMAAILFITFCMEIGCFLLIFPWTEYWDSNYFSGMLPVAQQVWDNMYLRGAVSGVGLVNLYICFGEILRLRRFSRR